MFNRPLLALTDAEWQLTSTEHRMDCPERRMSEGDILEQQLRAVHTFEHPRVCCSSPERCRSHQNCPPPLRIPFSPPMTTSCKEEPCSRETCLGPGWSRPMPYDFIGGISGHSAMLVLPWIVAPLARKRVMLKVRLNGPVSQLPVGTKRVPPSSCNRLH